MKAETFYNLIKATQPAHCSAPEPDAPRTDYEALFAIRDVLDGQEWTPDTCNIIADILRSHGLDVSDV